MLSEVLERSRQLGFLGPGSIDDQIEHSERFGSVLAGLGSPGEDRINHVADIGAGGGVPSLPVLVGNPSLSAVLIDASQRRCSFLVWACAELGLSERVDVWCGRLEEIAHEERARGRFDAVMARGFGPPAITVECGSGLLRPGGHLIISEPPEGRTWPPDALAKMSLEPVAANGGAAGDDVPVGSGIDPGFAVLRLTRPPAADIPRPFKQQQRKPLF